MGARSRHRHSEVRFSAELPEPGDHAGIELALSGFWGDSGAQRRSQKLPVNFESSATRGEQVNFRTARQTDYAVSGFNPRTRAATD
jgi:hypothetical protein